MIDANMIESVQNDIGLLRCYLYDEVNDLRKPEELGITKDDMEMLLWKLADYEDRMENFLVRYNKRFKQRILRNPNYKG